MAVNVCDSCILWIISSQTIDPDVVGDVVAAVLMAAMHNEYELPLVCS